MQQERTMPQTNMVEDPATGGKSNDDFQLVPTADALAN